MTSLRNRLLPFTDEVVGLAHVLYELCVCHQNFGRNDLENVNLGGGEAELVEIELKKIKNG